MSSIIRSLDIRSNISLEASAGTGKTFQLSMRIIAMLLQGVAPGDILALTFTKKATGEMLDRVVTLLTKLATDKDIYSAEYLALQPIIEEYARRYNIEFDDNLISKRAKFALQRLLKEFSLINIRTIDSYSNLILKLFPFEASVRPDFEIIADNDDILLRENAYVVTIEKLLDQSIWREIFRSFANILGNSLNYTLDTIKVYVEIVNDKNFFLSKSLKKDTLKSEEILALLEKALVLSNKILKSCNEFKLFFSDVVTDREKKVIDKLDDIKRVDLILEHKFFQSNNLPESHSYFKKYNFSSNQLDKHKEILDNILEYLRYKEKISISIALSVGREFISTIQKMKLADNVLTYNDITDKAYQILYPDDKKLDKEYLYFRLDSNLSHILIDEFQDTSLMQWLILKPLAVEAMAGLGQKDKAGSFFYVGDPKQNLYRFRGSSSELFSTVSAEYQDKIIKESLGENFRSSKSIVEFVNRVSNAAFNYFKYDNLEIFKIDQQPADNSKEGFVRSILLDDKREFAESCIEEIEMLISKGYGYSDIAILVPTNKLVNDLRLELVSADIPTLVETSMKLNSSSAYQILSALVRTIYFDEQVAFLNYKYIFPSRDTINGIVNNKDIINRMNDLKRLVSIDEDKTVFEIILLFIDSTDLYSRFNEDANFAIILDVISRDLSDESNPIRFLSELSSIVSGIDIVSTRSESAVSIMTINKSKGLQFNIVILPNLDISLSVFKPTKYFMLDESEKIGNSKLQYMHKKNSIFLLDEFSKFIDKIERNTTVDSLNKLYVALTRAKEGLIVFSQKKKDSKTDKLSNISYILDILELAPFHLGDIAQQESHKNDSRRSISTPQLLVPEAEKEIKIIPRKDNPLLNFYPIEKGDFIHKILYLLDDLKDIDESISAALNFTTLKFDKVELTNIRAVISMLAVDEFYISLYKGRVFKEKHFTSDGSLFIIDFFSIFNDKIILIDYKTGIDIPEYQNKYAKQLKQYSKILKNLYKKEVESYLIYLDIDKIDLKIIKIYIT